MSRLISASIDSAGFLRFTQFHFLPFLRFGNEALRLRTLGLVRVPNIMEGCAPSV
nr:hypothetical protein Q903MT_gene4987 [Picea sitchensis]